MNRHNDKDIKELVSNFIDAFNLRPKYIEYQVRSFWKEEMSPMINRYTTDINIKNQILYIKVSSAPVKHDLFIQREQIKTLINKIMGEPYIKDVVIR